MKKRICSIMLLIALLIPLSAQAVTDGRGQETADTPCHRKAESFRTGSPALQNL